MIDETPVAVVRPAHAWNTIREACAAHAKRLRYRSRTRQTPAGYTDTDALRAETLEATVAALDALREGEG